MLCVIASEAALFGYLVFSYFYYAVQLDDAGCPELPPFRFSLPGVIVLIASSIAIVWACARPSGRGAPSFFSAC